MCEGNAPTASQLAAETNLSRYQGAYTVENSKVRVLAYDVVDLIPPMRKHTFAPEIDLSKLIDDEAEFQALPGINWSSPNFQTTEEEEEPTHDKPEASTRQDQDKRSTGRLSNCITTPPLENSKSFGLGKS